MERAPQNILEWSDLKVIVRLEGTRTKTLLDGVSGRITSGELCILMGPSGAGKTTLLNILAGRNLKSNAKIDGEILINGSKRDDRWKRCTGYVEQFDLLHQFLTPREILTYAARFKCLADGNTTQIRERTNTLLHHLGLTHIQSRRLCSGVSGGEKKRISIGQEVLGEPSFLFLDEPTSGLDAFNAFLLIKMLQNLAREGNCCVMITLHQPRYEILTLVSKVMLLAMEKLCFLVLRLNAKVILSR